MPDTKPRIRLTAYNLPVKAIVNSIYLKEEEEFSPNYIKLGDMKISRVNIIAIIVSISEQGNTSLVVEDGTAKISIRGFEQNSLYQGLAVGDIVNIIGRPREFNSEKYILPEIIKKTNQKWMLVRKLELAKLSLPENIKEEIIINESPPIEESIIGNQENIIMFIREKDKGEGVEIEDIIKELKQENSEKIIETMLKEGELFENMPGRIKVLE